MKLCVKTFIKLQTRTSNNVNIKFDFDVYLSFVNNIIRTTKNKLV